MTNKNFKFFKYFFFSSIQFQMSWMISFHSVFYWIILFSRSWSSDLMYTEILGSKCFQALIPLKFFFLHIFIMLLYKLENICPKMENWCTTDSFFTCSPWFWNGSVFGFRQRMLYQKCLISKNNNIVDIFVLKMQQPNIYIRSNIIVLMLHFCKHKPYIITGQ